MLNDLFITRDVIGFLRHYLISNDLDFPGYQQSLDHFSDKQQMSFEEWWGLLEELSEIHPVPALGLKIGQCVQVTHCGVLGYLFRTSRNVEEALNCFKRFQRLIYAGSQAYLEANNNDTVSIIWDPDFGYSSQLSDELLLAAMVNISREIIYPSKLSLEQVNFTQSIDINQLPIYEDFFECKVKPQQEKLSISFKLTDLQQAIPHEDQTLHSILGKQAEELLNHLPDNDTFLVELRDTIIRSLHEGRSDAETIARKLHISNRTLHRRLKTKNRIFRDILKDIRKSMAITYLSDDKLTLTEVALLLGFSEQSTFSRAFSNWYGSSPLKYKKQNL